MINNKKIVVVMPAYNAEKTLETTYKEIPFDIVDDVIVVDDCSTDKTVDVAHRLGIKHVIRHEKNTGYGGNQKTCYNKALSLGADVVIMVHPDYQYTPKLIPAIAALLTSGLFPAVLASRILGKGAIDGGMPVYKYIANRLLTFVQNIVMGEKLSEYHTGYRAFTKEVLQTINYQANSNDFVFDNQMLSQVLFHGFKIAEISCPTKYFDDASSINFKRSCQYGLGVLGTSFKHRFEKWGFTKSVIYERRKIENDEQK